MQFTLFDRAASHNTFSMALGLSHVSTHLSSIAQNSSGQSFVALRPVMLAGEADRPNDWRPIRENMTALFSQRGGGAQAVRRWWFLNVNTTNAKWERSVSFVTSPCSESESWTVLHVMETQTHTAYYRWSSKSFRGSGMI